MLLVTRVFQICLLQGVKVFRNVFGFLVHLFLSLCGCHNEHNERIENFDEIVLRKRILGRPRKRWNSINSKFREREFKLDRTG